MKLIKKESDKTTSPLSSLRNFFKKHKFQMPDNLPSISSGFFGFLGYEMIRHFENVDLSKVDDLDLPESVFIRPSITLVFDNVSDKLIITKLVSPNNRSYKNSFDNAKEEIFNILKKLNKPLKKDSLKIQALEKKKMFSKMFNQILILLNLIKWLIKQKNTSLKEKFFKL